MINILGRYIKITRLMMVRSFIRDFQFRRAFWLTSVSSLLWSGLYLAFYVFIFGYINQVKGWTRDQCLVLVATFLLINSLFDAIFEENFKQLPPVVYEGGLDYVLTKPISSQFLVSMGKFSYHKILRFILTIIIVITIINQHQAQFNIINSMFYLLLLVISLIIVYALWFSSMCLVFWFGNIENVYMLFHPFFRFTSIPLDILPPLVSQFFFFIFPLMFISTVPAKALLGIFSWPTTIYGFFISALLLWSTHKLWNFVLKRYSSVSR